MASQKRPPWKCAHCHVIMKGTFPRCWKCGLEWAHCVDRAYVPPDQQQQDGQPTSWGSSGWQQQKPKSPRTRSRKPSRSKYKQQDAHWGGGDSHAHHGSGYVPQPQPHMMPAMMPTMPLMMMPYHQPPMMHMMTDKGHGKGVGYPAPLPPMPPPSTPPPMQPSTSAIPAQVPTWDQSMQMMPIPVPPSVPAASVGPAGEQKSDSQAQKKLNKLLSAMKKEEDTLSPTLQSMAHDMQKKDERNSTQETISAAKELGDAKETLLEAENARAQLLSQWKIFLQQSVVKWQEFTSQFQASEVAHQTAIQQARLQVRRSQRRFDHASRSIITDEETQTHVISDQELEDVDTKEEDVYNAEGASKIHQGMTSIVTSLQVLSESADQLEQRVKRPRKNPDEEMGAKPPFGPPGVS